MEILILSQDCPVREFKTKKAAEKYARTHTTVNGNLYVRKMEKAIFNFLHEGPVWGIFIEEKK